MTHQQNATECSLRVVWILGKHKKPLSDAEIIKECMTKVMDTCLKANKKRKYSTMYVCMYVLIYVKMEMTFYFSLFLLSF